MKDLAPDRYAATDSGRFSWRSFSAEESAEVVVFDRQTGTTHRLHSGALTIFESLSRFDDGMTLADLLSTLWGDDTPNGEEESTQLESACAALLSQMQAMGMVRRVPTNCA